jgi:ABC-type sugar transport system substrate-binding protein
MFVAQIALGKGQGREGGPAMTDLTEGSEGAEATLHRRELLTSAGRIALAATAVPAAAGLLARASWARPGARVTTVGFDHPFNFVAYVSDLQKWMKRIAKENGYKLLLTNDQAKLELQIQNLETWIAARVPAIISFPLEPKTIEKLAAKARKRGITFIGYAVNLQNDDSFVDFQNELSGRLLATSCANWVKRVHRGKAKIIQLNAPDVGEIGRLRDKGIRDTLRRLLPGSQIVATQKGVVAEEGLRVVSSVLAAHPDVKAVIGMSDDGTAGAYQAFIERGHKASDPQIRIGGIDGGRGSLELIKKRTMYRASAAILVEDLARACVEHPIDVANGVTRRPRIVPVRVLEYQDQALLRKYISQLSKV